MKVLGVLSAALVFWFGGALGRAAEPEATTLPAETILSDRATIRGRVFANGLATRVFFQWGLTTNYELTVPGLGWDLPAAWTTEYSLPIYPLAPVTAYHYRMVATNAAGSDFGADAVFTTAFTAPPTASTAEATNVTAFSARMGSVINPHGLVTTVFFEWGVTTNYTKTTPVQSLPAVGVKVAAQQFVSNLVLNTTYHFRVVASNSAGISVGGDFAFTTLGYLLPDAATTFASGITTNAATLNGSVNPSGLPGTGAFQWGLTTGYGNTTPAVPVPAGTTHVPVPATISNLVPGATYHFRTVASNDSSAVSFGLDYTFTTPLYLPPIALTADADQQATRTATLLGSVNPNGPLATAWFDWGATTNYGFATSPENIGDGLAPVSVAHEISGLVLGGTYHFRMVGSNVAGLAYGSDQTFAALLGPPVVITTPAMVLPAIPPSLPFPYAYLKGTVQPNDDPTTVYFQWGTNTSYGDILTVPDLLTGTSSVPVQAFLYPLTVEATYHYRLVAYNRAGTNYGADLTFRRPGEEGPTLQIRRENRGTNVIAFAAEAGRSYALERTTDLAAWISVATNTAPSNSMEFRVPVGGSPRFYRVLAQ